MPLAEYAVEGEFWIECEVKPRTERSAPKGRLSQMSFVSMFVTERIRCGPIRHL